MSCLDNTRYSRRDSNSIVNESHSPVKGKQPPQLLEYFRENPEYYSMGKTGLQDLPPEIVRHIIEDVERKHALLLVCKVCFFFFTEDPKVYLLCIYSKLYS